MSHTWIKNRAIIVLHVTLSASVWLFLHPSILLVCAAQSVSSALFHVFTSTFTSVFFFLSVSAGMILLPAPHHLQHRLPLPLLASSRLLVTPLLSLPPHPRQP